MISQHPDFASSSATMNVLPSGSYDVVTETGMPTLSPSSPSISPVSYGNQSYTFVQNYTTDVDYITDAQSVSVTEKTSTQVLPDLSCSLSSSTSIVFSLGSFNSEVVPSWVAVDVNTGLLTITSPEVEQDTNYSFYVNAMITGVSKQIQKLIKLTVTNWDTWGSQITKDLSVTTQYIIWATVTITSITSMLNVTSGSSLWLMINQVQLFFLLLLTRAYIPDDIKLVITGLKFTLNLPSYLKIDTISTFNSVIDNFNFELSNYSLSNVGVSSDSSVYNTAPFFTSILIVIVLHLLVIIFMKLFEKCSTDWVWYWIVKIIKWIIEKLYNLLTFGFYIRAAIEINQYLLICSAYEAYMFNTSQKFRIASLAFAMLVLIGWILIEVFALCLSISSYVIDEDKHNKLGELFSGLKMDKKFKFYVVILIFRRSISVRFKNIEIIIL